MEPKGSGAPEEAEALASSVTTALSLVYSAPTPGLGSRYADSGAAASGEVHEARMLFASVAANALGGAAEASAAEAPGALGESVLRATLSSLSLSGYADPRSATYLAPLIRARLSGLPVSKVLARLGAKEMLPLARAFEAAGKGGPLVEAFGVALSAGAETTLRDAMRFASRRDALARDYAANFEVPRELARPALLSSLSRAGSTRAALVQSYLEVLSEVVDLDVAARAGRREAEEVSRMARGVLKAGGAHSRRGLEGIANLDGILREDRRLSPTATEPVVASAAFMVCLEHGPEALGRRVRPALPEGGRR